jgi:hypothetical protein
MDYVDWVLVSMLGFLGLCLVGLTLGGFSCTVKDHLDMKRKRRRAREQRG